MVSRESQTEQQRMQAAVPLTVVADANFAARSNCSEPPVRGAYTWETVSTVKCLYRSDLGRKLGLDLPCTARGNTPCSARNRRTASSVRGSGRMFAINVSEQKCGTGVCPSAKMPGCGCTRPASTASEGRRTGMQPICIPDQGGLIWTFPSRVNSPF